MNVTDLEQVLEERSSDTAEQVAHHLRLHGVRTKVVARRRRRIAAWSTCAVVVLGSVTAAAVLPKQREDGPPTPAQTPTPVRTVEGFAEYANGAHVIAAQSARLPAVSVTLTIVPATLDLMIFSRCDSGSPSGNSSVFLEQSLTVNGHQISSGSCGGGTRPSAWDRLEVAIGRPATFVMTITRASRYNGTSEVEAPLPDKGTFGLAIGERMPFEAYPLPPRPSGTLRPLEQSLPAGCTDALCPGTVIVRSDPADVAAPVRRTVTWQTLNQIDMVAQTPGLLHIRVNGVEVATGEWWDYTMAGDSMFGDEDGQWKKEFGLDPRPGDQVTIEIVPEHLTGTWQVVFSPR